MKKLAFAAVFMCMFILFGCPLQTENSMDMGSYKVPSWLTGTWKQSNSTTSATSYYIDAVKGKTGHIVVYTINSLGEKESQGRNCILSDVGGQPFLSAYDAGDDEINDAGWYIYKFNEISKNEFEIIPVKEHSINYSADPAEIKAFLEENKDKEETYTIAETERYTKVK